MVARRIGVGGSGAGGLGMRTWGGQPFFDPFAPLFSPLAGLTASPAFGPSGRAFPPLNLWETQDGFTVEAELPGFEMNDVNLSVQGEELTISGGRETRRPENGAVFHRRERPSTIGGRFARTIHLGAPIDADRVSATMDQGVLTISLPKAPQARPRQITVKTRGTSGPQQDSAGRTETQARGQPGATQPRTQTRPPQAAQGGQPSQGQRR